MNDWRGGRVVRNLGFRDKGRSDNMFRRPCREVGTLACVRHYWMQCVCCFFSLYPRLIRIVYTPYRIVAMAKNFGASNYIMIDRSIIIETLATLLPYPSRVHHFP